MSSETPDSETVGTSGDLRRILTIGLAAAAVIVLFVTTVSIILIFALRSDVAVLEDQARNNAKETNAVRMELADIREKLKAFARKSSADRDAQPANIDGADPSHDCVIRPGQEGSVANCIELGTKERH